MVNAIMIIIMVTISARAIPPYSTGKLQEEPTSLLRELTLSALMSHLSEQPKLETPPRRMKGVEV
jgi:hypothetical protein